MNNFKVHKINFSVDVLEQLGTKEKFWFVNETNDMSEWLFKFSRKNTGEHWSEKVAEQLCEQLDIPHVKYELAICDNRYGIITKNAAPENCRVVMGNEILHSYSSGEYPLADGPSFVRVKEHTVSRVLDCLDNSGTLPPKTTLNIAGLNAGDLFCGYLLLDALISNQDRHHENWAVIVSNGSGAMALCPTYDHAASLGRELLDKERHERLQTKDRNRQVEAFVLKAKSELFKLKTDKRPLKTIDAFYCAVECRKRTKNHWLAKLKSLSESQIMSVFQQIPDTMISQTTRTFAIKMVLANKTRLLEDDRA